jgi:CubicO group peptidase (beta-lactamase class C family)
MFCRATALISTPALLALAAVPAVARDAATDAQVDEIFSSVAEGVQPGCAVGVVSGDALVLERAFGYANLEHQVPIGPQTAFDVSSVSKQLTAAAVALLAERGALSLDDPVRAYLPELRDYGVPLTLRHLVHHTGGVRDYLDLLDLAGRSAADGYTLDELVQLIGRQSELNFVPGSAHLYSNSGYLLLAAVVERVAGRPLARVLQEEIFEPLGMASTRAYDDPSLVIPGRATAYAPRRNGYAVDHYYRFAVPGDGQLYTTVGDLGRWQLAFEKDVFIRPGFMASLLEPGRLSNGEPLDYAFGLRVGELRGLRTARHGGAWGGFRSHVLRFPDVALSVITLCNNAGVRPEELSERVAEIYLGDRLAPPTAEPSLRPSIVALEAAQGLYGGRDSERLWQVALREGSLVARALPGPPRSLRPIAPGRYRIGELPFGELRVEAGAGGRRQILITLDGVAEERFDELPGFDPGAAELSEYGGRYRSEDLDVVVAVEAGAESLQLVPDRGRRTRRVWPGTRDVFFDDSWLVRFERDASGRVVGLSLGTERALGVLFSRLGS